MIQPFANRFFMILLTISDLIWRILCSPSCPHKIFCLTFCCSSIRLLTVDFTKNTRSRCFRHCINEEKKNPTPAYVGRILRLNLIAPNIVKVIIEGKQPRDLKLQSLMEKRSQIYGKSKRRCFDLFSYLDRNLLLFTTLKTPLQLFTNQEVEGWHLGVIK